MHPNPMVGCVIVSGGVELARGWHEAFGGPHAERQALADAAKKGVDVRGATMYVTLEPCSHHGKTPPCTEAVIEAGLRRVVVAMVDPDPRVSGRGIEQCRQAGIDVDVGICEDRARSLLGPYVKLRTTGRPWVICKWAQTADGYLSLPPGEDRWITGPSAREHVHQTRSWIDAIAVGVSTVLADDPQLTNRSGQGSQPVRIVLDSHLRTPPDSALVRSAGDSPVLIATTARAIENSPVRAETLRQVGVELLALPEGEAGVDLPALLAELGHRQWTHLLVEGGAAVLGSFLTSAGQLADELHVYVNPRRVDVPSGDLPRLDIAELARTMELPQPEVTDFGNDRFLRMVLTGGEGGG